MLVFMQNRIMDQHGAAISSADSRAAAVDPTAVMDSPRSIQAEQADKAMLEMINKAAIPSLCFVFISNIPLRFSVEFLVFHLIFT